jgi:palmitoyltransferase ZDHHC9/14/18
MLIRQTAELVNHLESLKTSIGIRGQRSKLTQKFQTNPTVQIGRLLARLIPNAFVVSMGGALFIFSNVIIIPGLISSSTHAVIWAFVELVIVFFFAMWLWSWLSVAINDPGRTRDDLQRRGVLRRVEAGDIPRRLRHLPVCIHCGLPRPPLAVHCASCNACLLRHDHHCGVTGQCVADKNFKPFMLSFFWGGIFAFSMFLPALIRVLKTDNDIIGIVTLIYSVAFGLMLWGFGVGFLLDNIKHARPKSDGRKSVGFHRYFETFGERWWFKFVPIQRQTTVFAWPDVHWNDRDLTLL